ncbi:MAG: hypothetical protein ACLRRT_07400 [Ruthenibacterium lactatiformans]
MELMILPEIATRPCRRARDELPQSAAGRTIDDGAEVRARTGGALKAGGRQ